MPLQEQYQHSGSIESFETVMDCVSNAMSYSSQNMGEEVTIYRCVKYTGDEEWRKYSMNKISMPDIEMSNDIRPDLMRTSTEF